MLKLYMYIQHYQLIYYFLGARVGGDITLIVSLPYAKIILHHMGILLKVLTFYPMWAHATKVETFIYGDTLEIDNQPQVEHYT